MKEEAKSYRQENALILKQKANNIFSGIKMFFVNMIEEVKLYREERKQNKELDAKLKEEENLVDEEYIKMIEELKEQQRKAKESIREEHNQTKVEQQHQQGTDRAAGFRNQMAEMAKTEDTAIETTTAQDEPTQEQPQVIIQNDGAR